MDNLFSTHPNVENRIRALEAMAGDTGPAPATRPTPIPTVAPPLSARRALGLAAPRRRRRCVAGVLDGGQQPRRPGAGRWRRLAPPERARAQALAAGDAAPPRPDRRGARRLPRSAARRRRRCTRCGWRRPSCTSTRVPAHAAVDGAVRLVRAGPGGAQLAGLVNAVARRVADGGAGALGGDAGGRRCPTGSPARSTRPGGRRRGAAIEAAHRPRPPLDLTLARPGRGRALGRGARRRAAADRQPAARRPAAGLGAARLRRGRLVGAGRRRGAAGAAASGRSPGAAALDLCAAPGGKTLQLAAAGAAVTAVDVSEARLGRLRENLARTGLAAETSWSPTRSPGSRGGASTRSCSTRPAPPPAPSAATRTCRTWRPARDLGRWSRCRRALLRARLGLARAGRAAGLLRLLAAAGRGRGAGGALPRRDAGRAGGPAGPGALGIDPGWVDAAGGLRTRPDYWPERGGMDGFYAGAASRRTRSLRSAA